jgi:hypothetical protein
MVTLNQVLKWLATALDAARNDSGDGDGATTALSYRRLLVRGTVPVDGARVLVITDNFGFSGDGWLRHTRITSDGAEVVWEERDIGIPTGADWLPLEFVDWMKGGESR